MIACVLSQLKPLELYIISVTAVEKAFSTAENIDLLRLHPIHKSHFCFACFSLFR